MHVPEFNRFYGCDIETTPISENESPRFLFGAIYGQKEKVIFNHPKEFWKFVQKIEENTVVAFFNMPFDFFFLVSSMPSYHHIKINYLGKPSFVMLKKRKKKKHVMVWFLDIGNFVGYSGGLKTIANDFCPHIPKKDFDIEQELTEENRKTFEEYCIRDAEICYTVIRMVFEKFGCGISLPQIAGRWLRRITRLSPKRPEYVKKIERESYFGGFVEIYQFKDIFEGMKLDVNSMFPYVMTKPLPRRFLYEMTENEVEEFALLNDPYQAYLCYVEVESRNTDWNVLPVRMNGTVICPIGRFSGWYWEHLLIFAKKYGLVNNVKIKRVLVYEKTEEHIKHIKEKYEERLKAQTKAENQFIKLFLNASYGKMAQLKRKSVSFTRKRFQEIFGEPPDYLSDELMTVEYNGEMWTIREYGNVIQLEQKLDEETNGGFTAISSYITSLARLEIAKQIVKNKEMVMSVDTDCITIKKEGFSNWESGLGQGLGAFKIEAEGLIKIHAPKVYAVIISSGKVISKIKGVPNTKLSKTQLLKEEDDHAIFQYVQVIKPREAERRKMAPYSTIVTEKEIFGYSRYAKGYVMPNGKVLPLKVTEKNGAIKIHIKWFCLNRKHLKKFFKKPIIKKEEVM